jgi:hypothetical protein
MKRIVGRCLMLAALPIGALALTPACAQNDQSIYIRDTLAPPTNRQNNECVYLPDPTAPFLPEGILDVAARDSYTVNLLIGSQLAPRGDTAALRTESNRAHLNGAVVTVTDTVGGQIGAFTATGTGFVDPQQNNTAAFGILSVTAIDVVTAQKIASSLPTNADGTKGVKLVLANIKAFGTTLGGVDIESGAYQFPIRVCSGCLINFATGDDPAVKGVDCSLPLSTGTSSSGIVTVIPCNAGQDEITPCQLCLDHPACKGQSG